MDQDEAVLRAAPATFLDRKSKVSNLYYALSNPPEYPLSKALTSEQAKRILDASFRHNPEFVRFEDARYQSNGKPKGVVYYYFADSPKFGTGRWAVKNQRVQFQTKRASNFPWKNVGDELFVVQAALASLENVAKRTGNEVLANIVAGWVTTREVAGERSVSKREAKELDEALGRFARHKALAADPKMSLEHAMVENGFGQERQDGYLSFMRSVVAGRAHQEKAALARKYFRYDDIPRAIDAYDLDHPPVAVFVGTSRIGDIIFGRGSVLVYGEGGTSNLLHINLVSDLSGRSPKFDPLVAFVGEIQGTISPKMIDATTRILRGYGFAYLDVPKTVGHRLVLIEALKGAGYVAFSDTSFSVPKPPRANPRRRSGRRRR